jgi:MYXO-CTERM domain-containing protein
MKKIKVSILGRLSVLCLALSLAATVASAQGNNPPSGQGGGNTATEQSFNQDKAANSGGTADKTKQAGTEPAGSTGETGYGLWGLLGLFGLLGLAGRRREVVRRPEEHDIRRVA